MALKFQIEFASRNPIYRQIVDQVNQAVARGKLTAGDRLPTVRQLSDELLVNPNTITRAYSELERSGAIFTRRGVGVFIAERKLALGKAARRQMALEKVDALLADAVGLGFQEDELISLITERLSRFKWTRSDAGLCADE